MILVTGSTGNVGREVVVQLAAAGHAVRALVRDDNDRKAVPAKVEAVVGDLGSVDSLAAALRGVDRLYLLAPLTPALQQHEANAIEAARRAGVKHIVKHSVLGAQWEAITLARWHRAGEKLVEASGIAWTHIRPSGFFSNAFGWADTIKAQGRVYFPTGDGKLGIVDTRDIAAVAVTALTRDGHAGVTYDVTGPAALSTREQVDAIAAAIGKRLEYVDVPDSAAREAMLGAGMPAAIADLMLEFTNLIRSGQAAATTDTVKQLTGQPPRTFAAWAKENAAAFR